MRVASKGQVTIPVRLRRKYGITPDVDIEFEETDRGPRLVVCDGGREERRLRVEAAIEALKGSADFGGMTTDEYMNFIRGYDEDADDPGFAD